MAQQTQNQKTDVDLNATARLSRLRELIPQGCWFDFGYTGDQPFVSDDIRALRPMGRREIVNLIEWLQLYLPLCPDDREIAHLRMQYCGDPHCVECYRRERHSAMNHYFREEYEVMNDPQSGCVVMYEVNGRQKLLASSRPERRLREIERQIAESVRYIHRIQTNDQMLLKFLWNREMIDYYVPGTGFFELPAEVLALFKSKHEQIVDRDLPRYQMMGIDLENPANLMPLLKRAAEDNWWVSQRLQEVANNV